MLAAFAFALPHFVRTPASLASVILTLAVPVDFAPASHRVQRVRADASPTQAICRHTVGMSSTWQTESDNRNVHWRAHWAGDNCSFDLRSTGDIKFNADFTDIASVSDGGTVELTEVQGSTARKLTVRSDAGGRLTRNYAINGREQPWDDDARRWLAEALVELDRMTAVGVDQRYPKLFAAGGARAVIDEAEKMSGDYARGIYLRRLVDSAPLTDDEYQRVVSVASRDMRSDYEMSRLLRDVADHSSLDNAGVRTAYINAVDRMSSDYERSRALQAILAKPSVSRDVARAAARAAGTFSSDYERSRVLLAAIESKRLEGDDAIAIIETTARSTSDYEKARVLLAVAARWTLSADARKSYLRTADTIRSDYENRRVLAALVKQESR
jgi:hypothetical protein